MSTVSSFGHEHEVMHRVVVAGGRAGWTAKDWERLAHDIPMMRSLRQVLLGNASVQEVSHDINCDVQPFLPDGYSVEEHQKGGIFRWDKEAHGIVLYMPDRQKIRRVSINNKLRKELSSKTVLNACVLDYLLANPQLIPEEWKGKCVLFWGTIYLHTNGKPCVRFLFWLSGRWRGEAHCLSEDLYANAPAAVRAS